MKKEAIIRTLDGEIIRLPSNATEKEIDIFYNLVWQDTLIKGYTEYEVIEEDE